MQQAIQQSGDPEEPDKSFNDARIKVRWAEHTIGHMQAHADQFIKNHYQTAGITEDSEGALHSRGLSPFFACHAGDAVFSLRSALDCCWMGLNRAVDRRAEKFTLPRAKTRHELKGTVEKTAVHKAMQGADRLILDQIRPYREGNEILWFGGQVDNWNKHNMLVVTLQKTVIKNMVLRGTHGSITITNSVIEGSAPGGLIGGEGLQLHPNDKADMTSLIVLVSRIPVDERPLMPFLSALLKETHEAVELFVATFGKKAA